MIFHPQRADPGKADNRGECADVRCIEELDDADRESGDDSKQRRPARQNAWEKKQEKRRPECDVNGPGNHR
jgi:hypothetical protein